MAVEMYDEKIAFTIMAFEHGGQVVLDKPRAVCIVARDQDLFGASEQSFLHSLYGLALFHANIHVCILEPNGANNHVAVRLYYSQTVQEKQSGRINDESKCLGVAESVAGRSHEKLKCQGVTESAKGGVKKVMNE